MRRFFYTIMAILSAGSIAAQAQPQKARPWTRWWWMGNAVDSSNIQLQLQQFHDAGIGGVEIVPIYGAKGAEEKFIKYLSPQWMTMLDYTVSEAKARDMGVYIAVGTGWPIGGPQVSTKDAATKLIIQQYDYDSKAKQQLNISLKDEKQKAIAGTGLTALMAYSDKKEIIDLTAKVKTEGTLDWKPASGTWKLYAAFTGKTLQKVKRAAPGGEGYTLDHFSSVSLQHYLNAFDEAFGKDARGVEVFYNDSYEVYNADWSPAFFDEFQKRRGYNLRKYLNLLTGNDSTDLTARIKSDFRETMSDLMLDNFAIPFQKWAQRKGGLALNQAHGSPANLLDLYAAADIPETESFGSSSFPVKGLRRDSSDIRSTDPDPDMMKFASSAAHATGQNLVSCETFTWLTEHFKTAWSQCKPEAEQVWLAGINHSFYHGTTYSPAEVAWPGWMFYASVEFNPANSLWPHLKGLNDYIANCQVLLQEGTPDNEIMVYWPVYDAWHKAKGLDMPFQVHNVDKWLYGSAFHDDIRSLQQDGYGVDFVSDRMLGQMQVTGNNLKVTAKGATSKILLIPSAAHMPLSTLKNILRIANAGATVIMQDLPEGLPGLGATDADRKAFKQLKNTLKKETVADGLASVHMNKGRILITSDPLKALQYAKVLPETLVRTGLKFVRRESGNSKIYFLVNHTAHSIDTTIQLQVKTNAVQITDPLSGKTGWVPIAIPGENTTSIRVQLASGQSLFLRTTDKMVKGIPWIYQTATGTELSLNGTWQLHFKEGGPVLPKDRTMAAPVDWTTFEDAQSFSGTGVYSTTFNINPETGTGYLLQLNGLRESARVWVNDQDAGYVWSNPMETDITALLRNGTNTLRIEVANLMANRIRYMDQQKISWRNYHEINFVNIDYKNFDASGWKLTPSGITGPVLIKELKADY
jgi:hypothetical protein